VLKAAQLRVADPARCVARRFRASLR